MFLFLPFCLFLFFLRCSLIQFAARMMKLRKCLVSDGRHLLQECRIITYDRNKDNKLSIKAEKRPVLNDPIHQV